MTQIKLDTRENPEWILMAKALRGELTEQEQRDFSDWLNADDAHTQQWTEALEIWHEVGTEQNDTFEPNLELAWDKLCQKAEMEQAPVAKVIPLIPPLETEIPQTSPAYWPNLYKYAAALIVAIGVAWVAYVQYAPSSALAQVATAAGQRQVVYLPDSSRVVLNENSTLRYQTAFSGSERKVELVGEGFFDVRKNPEQPFVVISGNAQTKVLGTSFNVNAKQGADEVKVAVKTGKVALASVKGKNQVLLAPGFTGTLAASGKLSSSKTQPEAVPQWLSLEFNNTPMEEVARQLEQYFSISIDIPNQNLQKCLFTGTFENPELKNILSVLVASSDLKISRSTNGSYSFSGVGCH